MLRPRIHSFIALLLTALICSGCATGSYSTIVGGDYDEKENKTDYFVVPFGSVSIPGKWEKTTYNTVSKQQFFKNENGDSIAVSFGPCDKYEFNTNKPLTGWEFLTAYYEWDSSYYVNTHGLNRELIKEDKSNNYIIWRVFGAKDGQEFDVYMLIGENNCRVNNYSVQTRTQWPKEQKISFLKNLYLQNH